MKILLVEDNVDAASSLKSGLGTTYVVDIATTGADCLAQVESNDYDLVLMDLGLPDISGFDLCRRLRAMQIAAPILVLSGQSEVQDKVTALDIGADDYLTKPFSLTELQARMRALLRRTNTTKTSKLRVADLELDAASRTVKRAGMVLNLRRKEFDLLEYFMRNTGRAVTREMIMQNVWDSDESIWTNVVDVHIKNLRDKIDRPYEHALLKTVYGVGYKLDAAAAAVVNTGEGRVKQ